jgi:hypothetical protein
MMTLRRSPTTGPRTAALTDRPKRCPAASGSSGRRRTDRRAVGRRSGRGARRSRVARAADAAARGSIGASSGTGTESGANLARVRSSSRRMSSNVGGCADRSSLPLAIRSPRPPGQDSCDTKSPNGFDVVRTLGPGPLLASPLAIEPFSASSRKGPHDSGAGGLTAAPGSAPSSFDHRQRTGVSVTERRRSAPAPVRPAASNRSAIGTPPEPSPAGSEAGTVCPVTATEMGRVQSTSTTVRRCPAAARGATNVNVHAPGRRASLPVRRTRR